MLKNILDVNGAQQLDKKEQQALVGGVRRVNRCSRCQEAIYENPVTGNQFCVPIPNCNN